MVENVSKLTNHICKTDFSAVVEIMKDTSKQSTGLLKEVSETLKEMANVTTVINQRQLQALQEESIQILLEQECQKLKQSMMDVWNKN